VFVPAIRRGCSILCVAVVGAVGGASIGDALPARTPRARCESQTVVTPRHDLPAKVRAIRGTDRFVGAGMLWTPAAVNVSYTTGGGWALPKQAWFRLEAGAPTITARRVGASGGTFIADLPPAESYPLWLNASIGPGFIPSNLQFSAPGCWRITATMGGSTVVLYAFADGSRRAICAELGARLQSGLTSDGERAAITADQVAHRCA
jgi:hypothetical protein